MLEARMKAMWEWNLDEFWRRHERDLPERLERLRINEAFFRGQQWVLPGTMWPPLWLGWAR